jgi:DNA polymerase III epsilon subunit-like protein
VDVEALWTVEAVALGLDLTSGTPPLIVEVALYHLTGGVVTGGPFGFWVAPDAPLHQVQVSSWPNVRLAPPWAEVAERVMAAIGERLLVVHERDRLEVLRRHLPDWQPAAAVFTRELAERIWPGLADYSLRPLSQECRRGRGATYEAHATALLLGAALEKAGRPVA